MAELYFADLCRKAGRDDVEAASAGVYAWDGGRISAAAAAVMAELGIDGSRFRSSRFTPGLARECDVIVGMTRSHCEAMAELAPECAGRIRPLFSGNDVPDPYGGTAAHYRTVFDYMKPALDDLARELLRQG